MTLDHALAGIARDDGTFLMVAMDQRESLRSMLAETSGRTPADVADAEVIGFKLDVAEILGPEASGFLVDPAYGGPALETSMSGTGRIVAADRLSPRTGEIVGDAVFDESLDLAGYAALGVVAAKLLVLWREDGRDAEQVDGAARFVAASRAAGLVSIVEGVVRPQTVQPDAALRCAAALGAVKPSLYKAEVPYHGTVEPDPIEQAAAELSRLVGCPWVVLSSHVERAAFPRAVEAACRGGASGLLAGRALWTNALSASEREQRLRSESVPYLRELSAIVTANARPWSEVSA